MKTYLILFTGLILLWACTPEKPTDLDTPDGPLTNGKGEVIHLKPLWKVSLHENGKQSNAIIDAHLATSDQVIVATTNGPENWSLTSLDINTGLKQWQWQDVFVSYKDVFGVVDAYITDESFFFHHSSQHFGIDLQTGSTKWKYLRGFPFQMHVTGNPTDYFVLGKTVDTLADYQSYCLYKGSLNDGSFSRILYPDFNMNTGGWDSLITTFNQVKWLSLGGKSYLALVSSDPFPNWKINAFLGLYDLEQKVWVYDRKMVVEEPSQSIGSIDIKFYEPEGLVYVSAGNRISCHNLLTGNVVWTNDFPADMMFSGFIVRDGVLVANCEDGILYGLDARTGQPRWLGEGAGTSSRLQDRYLNGVVYFSGGSTDRIHAVDIQTGKTLWRLDPGRYEGANEDDWKPDLYVVPGVNGEKGRVVACTYLHAYCFEAVR